MVTISASRQIDVFPVEREPNGYAQLVRCPWCRAEKGFPCRTSSGKQRGGHRSRWDEWLHAMGREEYVARAVSDDAGFWSVGDVLLCRVYRFDREKSTVLFNLTTGDDPNRNVYNFDIEVLRILGV